MAIKAGTVTVGSSLQSDGHVIASPLIPSTAKEIFAEFFLDVPAQDSVALQFRWYVQNQPLCSYSGTYPRGYVIAKIWRDESKLSAFPPGSYRVEIWFLNTRIAEKTFSVQ